MATRRASTRIHSQRISPRLNRKLRERAPIPEEKPKPTKRIAKKPQTFVSESEQIQHRRDSSIYIKPSVKFVSNWDEGKVLKTCSERYENQKTTLKHSPHRFGLKSTPKKYGVQKNLARRDYVRLHEKSKLEFKKNKWSDPKRDRLLNAAEKRRKVKQFFDEAFATETSTYKFSTNSMRTQCTIAVEDGSLPVYFERPIDEFKIAKSFYYTPIEKNIIAEKFCNDDLKAAMTPEFLRDNAIVCSCLPKADGSCACFNNKNCRCHQATLILHKNKPKNNKFDSHEMKDYNYYENAIMSCSAACACAGKCNNNIMNDLEQNKFDLELINRDKIIEWSIRTLAPIEKGTVFIEFLGEIRNDTLPHKESSYAFDMFSKKGESEIFGMIKKLGITKKGVEIMKKLNRKTITISPLCYGNKSRFLAHSCVPNMHMIRVFSGGISPAQTHCLLVASRDILPGEELTFDYGAEYVVDGLGGDCKCRTVACVVNKCNKDLIFVDQLTKHYNDVQDANNKKLKSFFKEIEEKRAAATTLDAVTDAVKRPLNAWHAAWKTFCYKYPSEDTILKSDEKPKVQRRKRKIR